MVSNVTTCHAPAPEPPIPAALAQRSALGVPTPALDSLVACHVYGAAVGVAGGAIAPKRAASPRKPSSAGKGYATATAATTTTKTTTSKTSAKSSTPAALAFLDDKNLSVEDKLLKLLSYLNKKWESDIDKKMREAANLAKGSSSSGSSGSSSGGALDVLGPVVGAVKSLSGPAMAAAVTALGFPPFAPLAAKLGPQLVDGVMSLASSSGVLPGATGSTSSSSSSGSATSASGSDREAQLKLMEIQRIIDQQKEMFSLVSNLLRSRHELRMGVIQNTK
jgi:hypothetical protein